jgi:hypothetical protein
MLNVVAGKAITEEPVLVLKTCAQARTCYGVLYLMPKSICSTFQACNNEAFCAGLATQTAVRWRADFDAVHTIEQLNCERWRQNGSFECKDSLQSLGWAYRSLVGDRGRGQ